MAGVAATLLLLALPSLASANPGTGPELVQRTGRLVVLHADRDDGTSTEQWQLVSGARHLDVHAPDDVWIAPGTPVRLEGALVGSTLRLADSQTAVTETGVAPMLAADTTASAPAIHSVVVILAQFPTGSAWPGSEPDIASSVVNNDLNGYYQENTYGQLGFAGTVKGPYTIQGDPTVCDSLAWMSRAMAAAGVGAGDYQHIVVAFPTLPMGSCNWSGQALIGGNEVWVNGPPTLRVLAHEFGHNLGLGHAGGLACGAVPIATACSAPAVYGDPFDPMGGYVGPVRQMNMAHKAALGLLPASAVKVVGIAGTYRIAPEETLSGSPELLRIPKTGGGSYYVEYRYPLGAFDTAAPALQGVMIRTDGSKPSSGDPNSADTLLIDMHPATASDWSDAAMDVGQTFSDPVAGVSIQNAGQDATGATLVVSGPKDVVPPNAPTGLTAAAAGTSAVLHWTAATDDYQVDSYVISRNGTAIATTADTAFQDSGLVPGTTVRYDVAAVDAGNNTGPAASASVVMPDTAAPAAAANVTARLTRDGKVHLAWAAAADNGQIGFYRVFRNGTAIATGTALAYVDRTPRPGSGPSVTYAVKAVDLAGNIGPAGKAKPLRSALLRTLSATRLKLARSRLGTRPAVRVTGKVSDAQARCRLRIGGGAWKACRAKRSGAFTVTLALKGTTPVTLSLRNSLGRVKTLTVRVRSLA